VFAIDEQVTEMKVAMDTPDFGSTRYWRSRNSSPFTWGWVLGPVAVGLLLALGLWAIPLLALVPHHR
jgi:hypothetical protein